MITIYYMYFGISRFVIVLQVIFERAESKKYARRQMKMTWSKCEPENQAQSELPHSDQGCNCITHARILYNRLPYRNKTLMRLCG